MTTLRCDLVKCDLTRQPSIDGPLKRLLQEAWWTNCDIMRRQRRAAAVVASLLLGAAGYASALRLDDAQTEVTDSAVFKLADDFDSVSNENATELLDDVVVPASLESEQVASARAESELRDLRPIKVSTSEHHTEDFPGGLPYGGALVAVQTTALLVCGATIVVLLVAKVKTRTAAVQYEFEYEEGASLF
jgi:ABC-type uncharacterized transport system YnjBCD permease subunit